MIPLDVNTLIGAYPFRHVPHPEPEVLVRVLDREGIATAWTGHLPSAWHRDPTHGNEVLLEALAPFSGRLLPVPAVRPDWPAWERAFRELVDRGVPAIRAYPSQWRLSGESRAMQRLSSACREAKVALVLTVRFEDLRQRHWMDTAGDLPAATIRALARAPDGAALVVTAAGRALIEEVHWGLTAAERGRITWDISWIWGPPENDLAHLLRTIGHERFIHGSQWPLRLAQGPRANLALLPDALRARSLAEGIHG
jgi:hypothetical protein